MAVADEARRMEEHIMEMIPSGSFGPVAPSGREDQPIEVWCESYQSWVRGFQIAGRTHDGYLVRRCSDTSVLPVPFTDENVRPAERNDERLWSTLGRR